METYNIFTVKSISLNQIQAYEGIIRLEYVLESKIDFMAENGIRSATLEIKTSVIGRGDQLKDLKKLFQAFLNGESEFDFQLYMNISATNSKLCRDKIHYVDIQLQEPLKSEVEKIFNFSNWVIPYKEIY